MNLREGTRRLALLLGVAGAIGGGFVSYLELQDILSQKARHNRFELLAASDVVQQGRKCHFTAPQASEWDANGKPIAAPQKTYLDPNTGEPIRSLGGCNEHPAPGVVWDGPEKTELNKNGVKTIFWDKDHVWNDASGIYSIETDDGQTLYPTRASASWDYLFVVICPIFGFFLPWGVIRAIGWVGAGFVASSK